jgi:hypothetical protein
MNKTKHLAVKIGFVLCSALLGYTIYGQPSVAVGVSVSLPSVEIRAASDFYEPLTPYGRWEVVGSYGRCWIPGGVEADWRPYCNGNWQRTDAGWYWVSDEPWAWATYHYGRWDLSPEFGWFWVPQTQWAPAWVSWHSSGGYIGWAPLYTSDVRVISPRAYVFVEERHFLEPVRRSALVANNTTLIKKMRTNKGPTTAVIEKASGRKVQAVPVQELRHKEEAAVVTRQRTPVSAGEKKVQAPVRSEAQLVEKKAVTAHEPLPIEKPAASTHESAMAAQKNNAAQSDKHKPISVTVESKPAAKPEGNHPPAIKEPTGQNANLKPAKQEQPAQEKPAASDNNGPNPADKGHDNNPKE